MERLKNIKSKYRARVIERTSQGKYKIVLYSNNLKKELGVFFISNSNMPNDKIFKSDINRTIQFTAALKQVNKKFYVKSLDKIKRDKITYTTEERRDFLSKYMDGSSYSFSGTYNYKRDSDNRHLFTDIKFIVNNKEYLIDHLNLKLKIRKELIKNTKYTFKAKVGQYTKQKSAGVFYGLNNVKNIKEENEMISIPKKEYDNLLKAIELLNSLKL